MNFDFTIKQYEQLCQAILHAGYQPYTIAQYLEKKPKTGNVILLRHDVDRNPKNALRIAQLESKLNLHSTYYFRYVQNVFKIHIIENIHRLGHEIGYHYETLSKAQGDVNKAIELFSKELKLMNKVAKVQTISMHGSPLSKFDNRDIWNFIEYQDFGLLGEAYLTIDYSQMEYFTDTGRTWKRTQFNLRDFTPKMKTHSEIKTTNDLISAIKKKEFPFLCVSTHPERWPNSISGFAYSLAFDQAANLAKAFLRLFFR